MSSQPETRDPAAFWDEVYQGRERVWSGRPNALLVEVAAALAPGAALDLGCGEGADTIWLAQRGWRVTAVDVSATALERAAGQAATAGVAERVDLQRHDLAYTFPTGQFDLVCALYLQSPLDLPRERILRAAAGAVAPGGLLLVVTHASVAPWSWRHHRDGHGHPRFPTLEETLAALELDPDTWDTEQLGEPERQATGPNGQTATVRDAVIALRRRSR